MAFSNFLIEVEENKLFSLSVILSCSIVFIDILLLSRKAKKSLHVASIMIFHHFIFCQKVAAAFAKEGALYLVERNVRTFSASS